MPTNNLISFEFCPEKIPGNFNASHNQLTSLQFCALNILGYLNCNYNKLITLEYLPKKMRNFYFEENLTLQEIYPNIQEMKVHELYEIQREIIVTKI